MRTIRCRKTQGAVGRRSAAGNRCRDRRLETGNARPAARTSAAKIRVRGPQMISSYRNRPEETAHTIRDGWLYTGDIGYFDDEGYLFVVDRKKELIISGGYNIYPREVDEVLNSHPDTFEVATVGMKDTFRGEIPVAFVVLKPGRHGFGSGTSRLLQGEAGGLQGSSGNRVSGSSSKDRAWQDRQAEIARVEIDPVFSLISATRP